MSQVVVLDASAVIAYLQGEPGEDQVREALRTQECVVTAANHAEIIAKSLDRGVDVPAIEEILAKLAYTVIDVTAEDGAQGGRLRASTRSAGLSLGDRLCLAVAQRTKALVLTADRPWLKLAKGLGLKIRCIRPDAH